jgi:hypothetical protein
VEIEEIAAEHHRQVEPVPCFVDRAFDALASGDPATHDHLVAERAREIRNCDAIVLAQFTLSRAVPAVQAVNRTPVYNSPGAAVAKMRRMVSSR